MKLTFAITTVALVAGASTLAAQGTYTKEIPAALAKSAKVTEDSAAKVALGRVPKGAIQSVELEQENGKLIYSYDIKVTGQSGIQEVAVSAVTGKVLSVEHETPSDEKDEAKADAKAKKPPLNR